MVSSITNRTYHFPHTQRVCGRMKFRTDYFFLLYFLIFFEAINPFGMSVLFQELRHRSQCFLAISQYSYIYLYILINFRRIDIKMNHFCLFGVSSQITGHTVIKTHTNSNQHITFIGIDIRSQIAVHTQHTFIQRMFCWQSRKPEQRTTRRHIRFFDKLAQFALCISQFNTLSNQYKRTFSVINQFGSSLYSLLVRIGNRNITTDKINFRWFVFRFLHLRIFGKVQYHRPRTTTMGNVKRTCYRPGYIFRTANLITPFSDWLGNTYQVNFLKSIGPKKACSYLSGNHHDRRTIDHRIRNACYRIGCSGTARHQANTYITRYTGITLCGMGGSLLVTNQDMVQYILMIVQGIEYRHNRTTGVTKDGSHSLMFQGAHQSLCTCY